MRINSDDNLWIEMRPRRNVKRIETLNDVDMREQLEDARDPITETEPEELQCGHFSTQD
jgi:hypothetical protein